MLSNVKNIQSLPWIGFSMDERAKMVIDWCLDNEVDTGSVLPKELSAAMGKQKYWCQGPQDYVDMVNSLVAAMRVRK